MNDVITLTAIVKGEVDLHKQLSFVSTQLSQCILSRSTALPFMILYVEDFSCHKMS